MANNAMRLGQRGLPPHNNFRFIVSMLMMWLSSLWLAACAGSAIPQSSPVLSFHDMPRPVISPTTILAPQTVPATPTRPLNIPTATGMVEPAITPTVNDEVQSGDPALHPPQIDQLKMLMFDQINADRVAAGLARVGRNNTAAIVGQQHAEEMARSNYFSHWDLAGHGPDYRYSDGGGLESDAENVYTYWYRYENGEPAAITNWDDIMRQAQSQLMKSPGHRENILDPAHTHVGIGIAYNPKIGQLWIAQEFINRYVHLKPIPRAFALGASLQLQGELLTGATVPLINLAYEPFPQPMSIEQLNATNVYASPAEIFQAIEPTIDSKGRFEAGLTLNHESQPGLYHIRLWVTVAGQADKIIAADVVVDVK